GPSSAVDGTEHDPYAPAIIGAGDGQLAVWYDPIQSAWTDAGRKVRITDVFGEPAWTSGVFYDVTRIAVGSGYLVHSGTPEISSTLSGLLCSLPDCADAVDLADLYGARGFAVAISGSRVYFGATFDLGCGQGITGALASCDLAEALARTCTPTYH